MRAVQANGQSLHVRLDGAPDGVPVVFANSLGTDLRLWDKVLDRLPTGLRLVRYDLRGHGLSACPPGPYEMDDLIDDAAALIAQMELGPVIFVGLSIGGMIGQGLAARRPDLVRALVLSNTAARMGTAEMWQARIGAIRAGGIEGVAETILDRWFGPAFRNGPEAELWGAMLRRTPVEGYLGCCAAIAGADLTVTTAALRLPVLAIAGAEDGASPPDTVAATAALVPGAAFDVIEGAGHLPPVETPDAYAALLGALVKEHSDV